LGTQPNKPVPTTEKARNPAAVMSRNHGIALDRDKLELRLKLVNSWDMFSPNMA